MKKYLFIYTMLIISFGLLCFFGATAYSMYTNNMRIAGDAVIESAKIVAAFYGDDTASVSLSGFDSDKRITIIASDGTVIADTRQLDLTAADTHLNRPEIQAALNDTPDTVLRYSSTLGVYLLYYALKVDIKGSDDYVFVRTAYPVAKLDAYFTQILPFLIIIFLVIIALCFVLSRTAVNRITRPLEAVREKLSLIPSGGYAGAKIFNDYEEIDAIVHEIDDVAQILQENINALKKEKSKVEYILNNISDAIFAVNKSKDVALINSAALNIFDVTADITGKSISYLTYDRNLLDVIDECVENGKSSISEFYRDGKTYILTAKYLEDTALTMAIFTDITDSRENAKQREEFFANASHELKTPLTAIKGFNELCAANNKDEKISKYIGSIARETDRMLTLIGDMLKLSELSSAREINPSPAELHSIAAEIFDSLSAGIAEKEIICKIDGECIVCAEQKHIYGLMKNLIENAVRYNTLGGTVTVSMSKNCLKVSDTGIGIAPESQTRLFERFYRVEKSRSIQNGGTGLGLAIVKHTCALYGWELSLKSRPGVGTEVTVRF